MSGALDDSRRSGGVATASSATTTHDGTRSFDTGGAPELIDEAPPVIPEYRIEREIGRGGMGRVFAAVELSTLHRRVALKTLARPTRASARERFFREARAAAALNHPSIMPIYECREAGGVPYYTMQLIDGPSVREMIERYAACPQPRPCGAALLTAIGLDAQRAGDDLHQLARGRRGYFRLCARWIADVADALECAHRAGILHRDIKPGNLILHADGRVVLADFGLARIIDEPEAAGSLSGTARYLPPERLTTSGAHDARADVYALGLTLYEMLTLSPARNETPGVSMLEIIRSTDPVMPSRVEPSIHVSLERICMRAIARDPADRFAAAADLARALRGWLESAGESVVVRLERRPRTVAGPTTTQAAPASPDPPRDAPPSWWQRLRRALRLG